MEQSKVKKPIKWDHNWKVALFMRNEEDAIGNAWRGYNINPARHGVWRETCSAVSGSAYCLFEAAGLNSVDRERPAMVALFQREFLDKAVIGIEDAGAILHMLLIGHNADATNKPGHNEEIRHAIQVAESFVGAVGNHLESKGYKLGNIP